MSNKSTYSLNSNSKKVRDSIPCRIEFIKDLLKDKKLESLVDFDNTDTEYFLPHGKDENASGESYDTRIVLKKRQLDFTIIVAQLGGKLKYIKSGTNGHTFKGESNDEFGSLEYAVKVVAYPKKERYGDIHDVRRPENAEIMMIKLLSYFIAKKQTPHIVLPIGTFNTDISTFVDLITRNVVSKDNDRYAEFVKRYEKGDYHKTVSILISEWANRGDLLDFIRKYHDDFTLTHWKAIFFQVLSVLAVIQSRYPTFRHNDMKANNILVHKITKQTEIFTYRVARCEYKVPNIGYQIKLWDFDFACIPNIVDNKKVESDWTKDIGVTPTQNRYYDVHYFFNTLIKRGFCEEVMTSDIVPQEVKDFINRVVPKKYQRCDTDYIHKKGRLLINDEYITADEILKNDYFFEEYRTNNINNFNNSNGGAKYPNKQDSKKIRKSFSKDTNNKNENKIKKITKKVTNIPDITKFLKDSEETPEEQTIKKVKSDKIQERYNKKNVDNEDKLSQILKNKIKSTKPKSSKSEKKNKKQKNRSRTISEEVRDLDPDILLNYTTT